jgi:hypothetical protein
VDGAKVTYLTDGFEIDLGPSWRCFPDDEEGLLYFQNVEEDAGLSVSGIIFDASGRDFTAFAQETIDVTLKSLADAASQEGGEFSLHEMEVIPVLSGLEVEAAGRITHRGRFLLYWIIRDYLFIALRIESMSLSDSRLAALFDEVQLGLFVGAKVQLAGDSSESGA